MADDKSPTQLSKAADSTHILLRKGNLGHDKHYGEFGKDTTSSHDKQLAEREIHGISKEANEKSKD